MKRQNALLGGYPYLPYFLKNDVMIIFKLFMTLGTLHTLTIMLIITRKDQR